jgi:predicted alpha/beta superfamily hydrolase
LFSKGIAPCIVVGIDNGGDKRMTEYNPYRFRDFGDGEGDKYVDFLVHTLKPYIDKHYRTLTGKESTCIAGSSMAGLITTYAVVKYPGVFGGAGIFSPAYWTAPQFEALVDSLPGKISARLFLYAGEQESVEMVPDMLRISDKLALKSDYFIYSVVDPIGRHNERSWRRWLSVFYHWMFNNSAEYPK